MFYNKKKLIRIVIITLTTIQLSLHGQEEYNHASILSKIEKEYRKHNYQLAALDANSALLTVDPKSPFKPEQYRQLNAIKALAHMKLGSPQHALEAFGHIHDQTTRYATVTSSLIVESLTKKIETLKPEDKLYTTLSHEVQRYIKNIPNGYLRSYEQTYENFTLRDIVAALKKITDPERLSILRRKYYEKLKDTDNDSISTMKLLRDTQSPLRNLIIDIYNASTHSAPYKKQNFFEMIHYLERSTNFETIIKNFIASEGTFAVSVLQSLQQSTDCNAQPINYLLGILHYHQHNYTQAYNFFTLSNQLTPDAYTEFLLFMCTQQRENHHITDTINHLIPIIKKIQALSKKLAHNSYTHTVICDYLNTHSIDYLNQLLDEKQYTLAQRFITLLIQEPKTASTTIEHIKNISTHLHTTKIEDNKDSIPAIHYKALATVLLPCFTQHHTMQTLINVTHLLIPFLTDPTVTTAEYTKLATALTSYIQSIETNPTAMKTMRSQVATLYYHLGKASNSIGCFDKAIAYGDIDSCYEKAVLLFERCRTKETEAEALELLKTHAQSSSALREKSLYMLAEIYFDYTAHNNFLIHTPADNGRAYHYLIQLYDAHKTKLNELLAVLCMRGIRYDEQWLLRPNIDRAQQLLQQQHDPYAPYAKEITYAQAIYFYNSKLYEKALQLFESLEPLSSLPTRTRSTVLLYKTALLLKTDDPAQHERALTYFVKATQTDEGDYSVLDAETHEAIIQKTTTIMAQNGISKDDLNWCYATARACFCHSDKDENKDTQKRHNHAIQCLRYAAQNGCRRSQFFAGCLEKPDITLTESLGYLLKIHEYSKQNGNIILQKTVEAIILDRVPTTIDNHYWLFKKFLNKNDNEGALTYLKSPFWFMPLRIDFTIPFEARCKVSNDASLNQMLHDLAEKCLQSPNTSIIEQQHAALLLGTLYLYSTEIAYLVKAIDYLNAAHKLPCQADVGTCLGIAYNKLGTAYIENNMPTESIISLEIAAESYHNVEAINTLATSWLNNDTLVQTRIPLEKIMNWLSQALIHHKNKLSQSLMILLTERQKTTKRIQYSASHTKATTHPLYTTLVKEGESPSARSKNYLALMALIKDSARHEDTKKMAQKLDKRPQTNPHICLLLAINSYDENNSTKYLSYLEKSFKSGVIRHPQTKNLLFVDYLFLAKLCYFIENIMVNGNNEVRKKKEIEQIITLLTKTGLNINHFITYLMDIWVANLGDYICLKNYQSKNTVKKTKKIKTA